MPSNQLFYIRLQFKKLSLNYWIPGPSPLRYPFPSTISHKYLYLSRNFRDTANLTM